MILRHGFHSGGVDLFEHENFIIIYFFESEWGSNAYNLGFNVTTVLCRLYANIIGAVAGNTFFFNFSFQNLIYRTSFGVDLFFYLGNDSMLNKPGPCQILMWS